MGGMREWRVGRLVDVVCCDRKKWGSDNGWRSCSLCVSDHFHVQFVMLGLYTMEAPVSL